jgi:glycosyltransferase involved in cell wall biosynthesis
MKIVVFAHTPPPHHGQSYMVQLMLSGFGGDSRNKHQAGIRTSDSSNQIECFHVNCRVSKRIEDIGDLRIGKFFLLLWFCLQAIWCRFRYGVTNLYYIPAPGKQSALLRDWLVMFFCRPFFRHVILHWHAAGLAKWLETAVMIRSRSITFRLMRYPDLSIVLSSYNRADAEKIFSRHIAVVSNGIPDPCPAFSRDILPRRRARFLVRQKLTFSAGPETADLVCAGEDPATIRVLYLAHCTREKGVFDAVKGVELANIALKAKSSPLSLRLTVAGTFVREEDKAEFDRLIPTLSTHVHVAGFVSGEQKNELLKAADLFCFPTYYQNENQPVNIIEAMAFGLPILTTRWRSIPELFPRGYPGLVDINSPEQVASAIQHLITTVSGEDFRKTFLANFTLERHLANLAGALRTVESVHA